MVVIFKLAPEFIVLLFNVIVLGWGWFIREAAAIELKLRLSRDLTDGFNLGDEPAVMLSADVDDLFLIVSR